jgi:hypothetical protein
MARRSRILLGAGRREIGRYDPSGLRIGMTLAAFQQLGKWRSDRQAEKMILRGKARSSANAL